MEAGTAAFLAHAAAPAAASSGLRSWVRRTADKRPPRSRAGPAEGAAFGLTVCTLTVRLRYSDREAPSVSTCAERLAPADRYN